MLVFWENTVTTPCVGSVTSYCVLTPLKETSVTRPGPTTLRSLDCFGALSCSVTFSGRTPTVMRPRCRCARSERTSIVVPETSTEIEDEPLDVTSPVNRLDCPRKVATKAVCGSS